MSATRSVTASVLISILIATVPFFLIGNNAVSFAQTARLTIETEKSEYETGENVSVFGNVGPFKFNQLPIIQVFNSKGTLYRADPVEPSADGSYSYEFKIGGKAGTTGTYRIVVTYGTSQAETAFEFTSIPTTTTDVIIDGKRYPIRVRSGGGSIPDWLRQINGDPQSQSLIAQLGNVANATELQLELDASLISTSSQCFIVEVDGQETPAECKALDSDTTLVAFTVPKDAKEFRVTGTFLAPEFGSITAIVLALAITGIIISTTTKYRSNMVS